MRTDRLVVVDATNLASRLYYAVNKEKYMASDAMLSITEFIETLCGDLEIANAVFVFDHGGSKYRTEIQTTYKGNRTPDPRRTWFITLFKLVCEHVYNIPVYSLEGVEADDLCASIVAQNSSKYNILLVTTDKDYMQLISRNTNIYFFNKKAFMTLKGFFIKYGIHPECFPILQACLGDNVDNIAKCSPPGCGEKTLTKLFMQRKTKDDVLYWLLNGNDEVPRYIQKNRTLFENNCKLTELIKNIDIPEFTLENTIVALDLNEDEKENIINTYPNFTE